MGSLKTRTQQHEGHLIIILIKCCCLWRASSLGAVLVSSLRSVGVGHELTGWGPFTDQQGLSQVRYSPGCCTSPGKLCRRHYRARHIALRDCSLLHHDMLSDMLAGSIHDIMRCTGKSASCTGLLSSLKLGNRVHVHSSMQLQLKTMACMSPLIANADDRKRCIRYVLLASQGRSMSDVHCRKVSEP